MMHHPHQQTAADLQVRQDKLIMKSYCYLAAVTRDHPTDRSALQACSMGGISPAWHDKYDLMVSTLENSSDDIVI